MRRTWNGRHLRRALLLVAALGFASGAGCAERTTGVPPVQSTGRAPPPLSVTAGAGASAAGPLAPSSPASAARPDPPWADAVRFERWADAATLLDALPEADRARAEMRYVRARVAIARKESAQAIPLLAGLETDLPALAADVQRWRAEAAADVGPHAEAAAYFARGTKSRDFIRAAQALEKGGDGAGARRMIDKAVTLAQKGKSVRDETSARAVRARLEEAAGRTVSALGDLRWLALNAAGTAEGAAAAEALDRLKSPLTPKERMQAVTAMIERGAGAEALAEVDRIEKQPGIPRPELLHARAMALYKARDWTAAAKAFQDAAAAKSGREAEQLYYAGRCLSRCDRDDEAIKVFGEVSTRYKKTFWSERATYLVARLQMLNGRFKEAAEAYKRYLASYPKGEAREDAEYERALSLLSSDSPKTARAAFGQLAQAAKKPDHAGRLRELEAVAALRAGDREAAVRGFTDVARTQPLTWAGMTARARLAALGAQSPPLIEPAPVRTSTPLDLRLPAPAQLLAALGLDADAEGWIAANEQGAAAPFVGRESEALCGMYASLSRAKRRYKVGNAAVGFATLMRAPSQSERWAWDCVYPRPYDSAVRALEAEHSLPRGLIHALMRQESAFDPVVVSPASAVGLMQLMPATAKRVAQELSVDFDPALLTQPDLNLRFGAFYIAKLLKMFRGNVVLAAAAYNAGPHAVSHWVEVGKDLDADLWVARIPFDETRNYVARVVGNLARYQWLDGGDAAVSALSLELPVDARADADAY